MVLNVSAWYLKSRSMIAAFESTDIWMVLAWTPKEEEEMWEMETSSRMEVEQDSASRGMLSRKKLATHRTGELEPSSNQRKADLTDQSSECLCNA